MEDEVAWHVKEAAMVKQQIRDAKAAKVELKQGGKARQVVYSYAVKAKVESGSIQVKRRDGSIPGRANGGTANGGHLLIDAVIYYGSLLILIDAVASIAEVFASELHCYSQRSVHGMP